MTGRAAAIQGGLATAGLLARLRHLAARARACRRRGGDRRQHEGRAHPRPLRGRQQRLGRFASDARTGQRRDGHLAATSTGQDPGAQTRRPRCTVSRRPSPRPSPTRRATCWARSRPRSCWASSPPSGRPASFGVLDAEKAKELGLDDAKKKLVITARGEKRAFVIGQPPQSSGESYLRDTKDGRVYLMPRALLADLQGASHRTAGRSPPAHVQDRADFDRLSITAGGKTRAFVVTNNHDPERLQAGPAERAGQTGRAGPQLARQGVAPVPCRTVGQGRAAGGAGASRRSGCASTIRTAPSGWAGSRSDGSTFPGRPRRRSRRRRPAATNNVETYGDVPSTRPGGSS